MGKTLTDAVMCRKHPRLTQFCSTSFQCVQFMNHTEILAINAIITVENNVYCSLL